MCYCFFITTFKRRDADDAVKGRNDYNFDGYRLKVERPRQSAGTSSRYVRGRPGPPSQRSNYRVIIEGAHVNGFLSYTYTYDVELQNLCILFCKKPNTSARL